MRKAAVDVGSNSVLLTIEEQNGVDWVQIYESSNVSGLGIGVKKTGLLSEKGIASTLQALKEAFQSAREHGVNDPIAATTMAARMATNTREFLDRAAGQGTPTFVLSGEDEAELGFQAVAGDKAFADCPRISIVDVGGQSTELVTAERTPGGWNVEFRKSYPIGTLALLGGTLKEECPDASARLRACKEIDDVIDLHYERDQAGVAIVLGATGTNLVSIREKMAEWDATRVHGAYLDYEEISKASAWLSELSLEQRSQIIGMERGREATLPIGALILERFLYGLRVLGCRVSTRGWRHALLENGLPQRN